MNYITLATNKIISLIRLGMFHIIVSNFVNKIIAFISNVFVIRLLTKGEYGIYTYSANIQSFFLLVNGLGLTTGMLQFCSENINDNLRNQYYFFSLKIGCIFDIGLGIIMVAFSYIYPFSIEGSANIFRMLMLMPILIYIKDYICILLRSKRESKKFAYAMNINSILILVCSALGSAIGHLNGYIVGLYIAHMITIFVTLFSVKNNIVKIAKNRIINKHNRSQLLHYSLLCCATNTASQTLFLMDTFLVGTIIAQASVVANYKIASAIPFQFYFIPQSILAFIQPYFAYHRKEVEWIRRKTIQFIIINAIVNITVGSLLLIIAKPFILHVYGKEYLDCIPLFRILVFSYIIGSCTRTPSGNIIAILRKVKFNFIVAISSGILNIFLDIWLIQMWGSMGAAIATTTVTILTGIVSMLYLCYLLKANPK